MRKTSQLFAAGIAVLACACQDMSAGPTDPESDAARGAIKNPSATTASVRKEQVRPDGLVTYSVRVRSGNPLLSSFQGSVSFAGGNFVLVSQSTTVAAGSTFLANTTDLAGGRIRFSAYTTSAFSAGGQGVEVMRFTVRPLSGNEPYFIGSVEAAGSTNGSSILAGAGMNAATALAADAACSGTSLWGDGNADNSVNITDAQQVARFATGLAVGNWPAVTSRGDVTGDGAVNIVDAQQIARFSVGFPAAPRVNTWIC